MAFKTSEKKCYLCKVTKLPEIPNCLSNTLLLLFAGYQRVTNFEDLMTWIQRGKQKRAVAKVLLKPMTSTEILAEARRDAAELQLRDVWRILQQFQQRELATCLNPDSASGKRHALTLIGQQLVQQVFNRTAACVDEQRDWPCYAWMRLSPVRQAVLFELATHRIGEPRQKAAGMICEALATTRPLWRSPLYRALRDLQRAGLVTRRRGRDTHIFFYRITRAGREMCRHLRNSEPAVEQPFKASSLLYAHEEKNFSQGE